MSVPIFGNWLQVGNDLTHRFLASMSKLYGDVFLLKLGSRSLVVVSDPKLATEVLHTQGVEFGSRPRNVVFDIFTGNGQDMVFTVYGDHWRKMRRIMTLPFFTNKVVQQYKNMWEEEMDLVVEDLHKREEVKTEGIVIRKRLQLMLYNIMYRMMFATKFESAEDPLFLQATKFNSERSRLAQSFEYNYAIETTLWSMEWAIAELVNHPNVQSKVRQEISEVLQGNPITESDLNRLPYLQAVVKETLRLHTPIPLLVPHMNLEEAKLGGHTIPQGSKVVVNAWWLANNPEWWKNPDEFRPERFLDEEAETEAVAGGKVDFRFLPFGVGRRSCPGIILALPILGLIVGKLVTDFEMRPPAGMEKVDVTEKGGQFSLHIATHSVVTFHPIKA
ncbi:Trans-cinnamate 4-monooxygenase [Acorus gramineus]|uniref:Trans-cinnamate 4-monooxygenase n=1 Tax=Acorus gramineus TaxID=55184 RepID=A0AAV9AY37_ACOGR|nr:Trans-cinnamate 4-monooxygenase [Acorus gramineus]